MDIRYNTRDYEPGEKLQNIIEKKLSKLDRFFVEEPAAEVVLRSIKKTCIMEITVSCEGMQVRCERSGENYYDLIDVCLAVLEKLIIKHKGKLNKRVKFSEVPDAEPGEEYGSVVRIKSVAVKPMDVSEAILQLELLGHDFYMFENSATGRMNTVYKRKDGNYGLIEPA